jgi:hypothetical protein
MINCCQSINGLEQINADVIILDGNNVETELQDLQTQIDNIQTEITNGGGYFQVICERNGSHQNNVYFSFGANSTTGDLKTYLPNCVVYGIAISSGGTITSAVDVEVIINSTIHTFSVPPATNSVYTNYNLNISVSQGQTLQAKFGTAGSGGTDFRISLFCRTSAVNGQSVNFYEPNFTLLNANQNAYLTDAITTSNNTQNHQLHFGIPRGRSVYAYLGSVSSGTASVSMDSTINTNGNQEITFNFVLQTGAQGPKGDQGDRGQNGSADPITIAVATTAGAVAGGTAGGIAGASSGASAGASAGSASANAVLSTINAEIDELQTQTSTINSKIQFFQPHTALSGLTECGGTTCSLFPTGDLNLGGAVFGTGNSTNNINMYSTGGMVVNSASTQFVNLVEMLNDLNVDGDVEMNGQVNITENLTCLSDITLNTFLEFTNATAYASNTFQSIPAVAPTNNNQGKLVLNSNIFTSYAKSELFNNQQIAEYPYLTFKTDAGFSAFDYGSIICNTILAPAVNNGGDFTFACNQLTISNNLVVDGDLQVVGNFNLNNLTLDNLTINNTLKTSLINPLDDNVVMDIGSATTELNLLGASIVIGTNETTNVSGLQGNTLSLGENESCEIIAIGYPDNPTETIIEGLELAVNTETINLGQNGTTTQITARADAIVIGDTTTHGKTTSIDTQNINIGINDTAVYPSNITIGSVESQVILTGNDINIGDNDNFTDTLNIISATISMGNSNITTDIINIDNTYINIGVNDDPEFPSNIIIGSSNSITDVYGDVITIGETTASTVVNIGNTNSNIICNGPTNNITMNTTTFNSNNTTYDVEAQNITLSSDLGSSLITIGSNVNLDTSVYINTKNINIGTEQTLLTTPKLYMGTNNKTDTRIRGKTIQVLATDKTSIINSTDIDIKSSNNITIQAPTLDIGTDNDTVNIQGDIINMGTTGVLNTINVGNSFSTVNITSIDTQFINVDNFFNQIGF